MTTPTTLPEALTEIEELRGQVRELLRLLGQEAPQDAGTAGVSTTEITRLNDPPENSFAPVSFQRKQTEHERVQTSVELRNVIETIPDIIFELDLHGNLSGWNKRFEKVTGFVPEELSGRPALLFVPECEHEQTAAAILRAMKEGYAELEGHLLTKDQRAIPYHWTGAALRNDEGQVVGITGVGRDVSEKKRIEAELRRQQQHLLAAQAMAHVGSWDWNIASGAMEWSEEQFRIFGYEPKAIPVTSETFLTALHPDDHDRVVAAINDTLEGKISLDVECRVVRPDGEIRTVHYLGKIIRAEDDSPVRLSGSALDITDRIRVEVALQQSEAHFRAMIENSSDIITVLDLDGTIRFESPSFERLLGYTQHEIDGRIAFDFIHPDDLPTVLEKFQRIVQRPGETQVAEFRFRHQDGSWSQFEGVGRATCDSQSRSCVIVNSRDITKRKAVERQQHEQAERLRLAMDIADLATWDWDITTNKVIWSDNCEQVKRLPSGTFDRTFEGYQRLLHPDDRPILHADINRALTGPDPYHTEHRIVPPGGEVEWIEGNGVVYRNEDGQPIRMLGTARNTTARRVVEEALRASEERFAAAVEGSTDVLWDAHRIPGAPWHEPNTPIWWSPRVRQLLCLEDREPFDTLGQWVGRLHPDDMNQVLGRLAAHIEERIPYDVEYRIRTNRGEYRWIRGRGQAIWDEQGEPRRMSGSCQDITDRKQAEEALRVSEERFATAFNEAAIGMALVAPDGRWFEVNQALCQIVGYAKAELQATNFQALTHPDDLQPSLLLLEKLLRGDLRTHQMEKRYLHKNGHVVWVILNVSSVRDIEGTVLYQIAQMQDITERKRAELLLEVERQVLESMATTKPLTQTLALLCQGSESLSPGLLASVCLLDQDGKHLRHGAAPSLPDAYNSAIDGLAIGPMVGSCGTAAYLGRQVIVADIATDPLWEAFRELALSHGLRACWSTPIISDEGHVLGTFALYYRTSYEPTPTDLYLIHRMTNLARIAIEQKRGEQALRTSEERLRQALLASNTGLWDWNTETGEVSLSKEWKSQLGFSETDLPNTFESWETRLHPDDRGRAIAYVRQYLAQPEGEYRQEFRLRHKDETYRWIEARAALIGEPNGRRVRLLGSHTDITARKQMEAELADREERLRLFIEHSPVALAMLDREMRYVAVSRRWLTDYRLGEQDLVGRHHYDVFPEILAMTEWQEVHQRCLLGAVERREEDHFVRVDGTEEWVRWEIRPWHGMTGEIGGIIMFTEVITERKRGDDALRKSEQRFHFAVEATNDGIWDWDIQTGVVYFSPQWMRLLGYSPDEVTPSREFFFAILHPDDHARTTQVLQEHLDGRIPVKQLEIRLRQKSGDYRWYLDRGKVVARDQDGRPLRMVGTITDVTERKRVEEALKASEERYARATAVGRVGVWELDALQGRFNADENLKALFGYTKEELSTDPLIWLDLVYPDDRATALEAWNQVSKGLVDSYSYEVRMIRKDGSIIWTHVRGHANRNEAGNVVRLIGATVDITDRKRADERVLLTQFSIDRASDAVLWMDPGSHILNVNDAACRMLNYTREELIALSLQDLDPNVSEESWAHHWEQLKQQGSKTFESKLWSSTGSVLEMEITANYLRYGGKEYDCAIVRDISERKRTEAELQRSHTFLRQVIDTTPNFLFAKDRHGRFTLVNQAIADAYGTTVDNLVGKSDADFNPNRDEVEFFTKKDLEVLDSLQERFIPEEKITDFAGQVRWLQTVKRPLLDDTGQATMVLGASTDITARKRVEEMLRQRGRDLRAAVEERERISEDLHDGILQSIFAVGLGLESCRTLVSKLPLPRKKAGTPLMEALNRAIGQLNHVMTDVRNFIAGIESHVLEEADIGETLRTMVQAMCASNGTACRVTIEEAAVRDLSTEQAYHVMNVMREALSNSIRHSGAGRITLSFKRLRRSVRLSVTDNGKGFIPDSARDVGHGLINMAARARKLGGRIEVRSRPRQGTKVLLDIPGVSADA
jgi:PAS domain S-box-containing protein